LLVTDSRDAMADLCQAAQRNMYNKGAFEYRDGTGASYNKQLHKLSWPVGPDVPKHAQQSSQREMREGKYSTLHPMKFVQTLDQFEPSFTQTYGSFGIRTTSDGANAVYDRLFTPSKSLTRPSTRGAASFAEEAADEAFTNGRVQQSISMYTVAIKQKPTLYAYEKRCAALAHVGKYKEALADAEFILNNGPPGGEAPAARFRVKAIKDYLKIKDDFGPGHHHANATLMCTLTPRDHRQWRSTTPSTYARAYPFGKTAVLSGYP